MTVTTLDPKTALIVVDLQNLVAGYPLLHPLEQIVERSNALADAFRRHALPVVLVAAAGMSPGRTEQRRAMAEPSAEAIALLPGLRTLPQDHRITKRARSAFATTDLDAWLKAAGVTQVVVAGVATSNGVESTARHAFELGYHVTLATDAMTDASTEMHEFSLARVFPKLGETGTTEQIIALLDARSAA